MVYNLILHFLPSSEKIYLHLRLVQIQYFAYFLVIVPFKVSQKDDWLLQPWKFIKAFIDNLFQLKTGVSISVWFFDIKAVKRCSPVFFFNMIQHGTICSGKQPSFWLVEIYFFSIEPQLHIAFLNNVISIIWILNWFKNIAVKPTWPCLNRFVIFFRCQILIS